MGAGERELTFAQCKHGLVELHRPARPGPARGEGFLGEQQVEAGAEGLAGFGGVGGLGERERPPPGELRFPFEGRERIGERPHVQLLGAELIFEEHCIQRGLRGDRGLVFGELDGLFGKARAARAELDDWRFAFAPGDGEFAGCDDRDVRLALTCPGSGGARGERQVERRLQWAGQRELLAGDRGRACERQRARRNGDTDVAVGGQRGVERGGEDPHAAACDLDGVGAAGVGEHEHWQTPLGECQHRHGATARENRQRLGGPEELKPMRAAKARYGSQHTLRLYRTRFQAGDAERDGNAERDRPRRYLAFTRLDLRGEVSGQSSRPGLVDVEPGLPEGADPR